MPDVTTASAADAAIRTSLGLQASAPVVPQVPRTQQAPQGPNPEVDELKTQNELLRNQMVQMNQNMTQLMGELESRRETSNPEVKMPTEEELEGMSRTEAIQKVAEAKVIEVINQRLMGGLRKMAGDVLEAKAFADEETLRRTFPNLKVDKYRAALAEKRASNPGLSALDAIRLIADPGDLSLAAPATRTQEAVHIESRGRSASAPVTQARGQEGPSEGELQAGFLKARQAGNRLQAERYLTEIMKRRPDVPARR